MPLYEYKCTSCEKHIEKRQKFSDPELTECPFCQGLLERLISAPAIAFKGGGWYADGYGNRKPSSSGSASSTSSDSSSTSTSTSSESSKPASAPAAPSSTSSSST